MMRIHATCCSLLAAAILAATPGEADEPAELNAVWAGEPVTLDGTLDDPVWQRATSYVLTLSRDREGFPHESASVQLAYDKTHLYVAVDAADSDVLQESSKDQDFHFKTGDVVEVFLKPKEAGHYWELYITPNQKKTVFFFEGLGRRYLPSAYEQDPGWLQVAARVKGSLNDLERRDIGWSGEMAIPLEELARKGIPLNASNEWTVLIGRYNYSAEMPNKEITMAPTLPKTQFHETGEWADLKLLLPR